MKIVCPSSLHLFVSVSFLRRKKILIILIHKKMTLQINCVTIYNLKEKTKRLQAYLDVYIWCVERWSKVRSANLNELNPLPPDVRFLRKTVETKAVAVLANTTLATQQLKPVLFRFDFGVSKSNSLPLVFDIFAWAEVAQCWRQRPRSQMNRYAIGGFYQYLFPRASDRKVLTQIFVLGLHVIILAILFLVLG